ADFKGNILGTQLVFYNCWGGPGREWKKRRWETAGVGYATVSGIGTGISGNRLQVRATEQGLNGGDAGCEARICGRVSENGTYRFSGKSFGRFSSYYNTGQLHINLITNTSDYLVGANNNVVYEVWNRTFASGEKSWSYDVNLTTSQPYVTAIFRNILKDGGRGDSFTHDFWDWKLVKI
ncbi:MAG: hypothetical protein EBT93_13870, partial [Alphaproteobacteria bacterium]|nr:hypothetical protein [Alphaproteobacteria bacterium]